MWSQAFFSKKALKRVRARAPSNAVTRVARLTRHSPLVACQSEILQKNRRNGSSPMLSSCRPGHCRRTLAQLRRCALTTESAASARKPVRRIEFRSAPPLKAKQRSSCVISDSIAASTNGQKKTNIINKEMCSFFAQRNQHATHKNSSENELLQLEACLLQQWFSRQQERKLGPRLGSHWRLKSWQDDCASHICG